MNTSFRTQHQRSQAVVLIITTTLVSFFWFPMPSANGWLIPFILRAAVRSAVITGAKQEIQSSRQRCKSNPKTCRPVSKRFAQWKSRNSRLKAARSKKLKSKYHRTQR